VRIVWLRAAEHNLEDQLEYIAERNPHAASDLANKIASRASRIARAAAAPGASQEPASWSCPVPLT